ncbi:MAG: hypothetical protein EOP88_01325 [Verrucomicrobiaceae bacterium]|nr:MAG: hypothetical protein EOP88_01325 [Verrucomicrobiaceae bacterium]
MKWIPSYDAPAADTCELPVKNTLSRRLAFGVLGATTLALTVSPGHAQTVANADAVYQGFLDAYLVTEQPTSGPKFPSGGYKYSLPYLRGSTTNPKKFAMWEEGFCITAIADACDSSLSDDRRELLRKLLHAFLDQHGSPLKSDWNDDIMWGTRALARGYQITGETRFLEAAAASWKKVWDRGWNDNLGGGILIRQSKTVKCTLVNAPFVINGCLLYSATADPVYLERSKQTYAWMRANLFNPKTGQVIECAGKVSDNIYNHGSFIQAANALYQITGQQQYFDDALAAIERVRAKHKIFTSNNGCEEFVRGLSYFARMNGLWDEYYPWLKANAQASWDNRRKDYNISWPDWKKPSPIENLKSMKAIGSLVIQQVTVIRPVGKLELKNTASNLSLGVEGNSMADGARVIQGPYKGSANAQWTFTHHPDSGFCQMVSVRSGKNMTVRNASTDDGAPLVQSGLASTGNDLWMPTLTIFGDYRFVNKRSGKMLENPGSSKTQGTQMQQSGYRDGESGKGGRDQRWRMFRQN